MEAKPGSNSSISDHHQPRSFRRRIETPAAAETLPEEIIEQILLNLPVRSLLKFTSVSKSWRSLISSNRFIEAHLEFSRKDPNFTHYRTISTFSPPRNGGVKHCSLPSLFNGNGLATDAVDVDFPFDFSEKSVRVMGSCNGLVCIVTHEAHLLILLNPSTRKFKKLPDVCDRLMNTIICAFKYGFGFVESTRDYKVLLVCCVFRRDSSRCETMVKVYSLTTNSWRRIEFVVEDRYGFDVSGIFVSGKLHWCKIVKPESNSTFGIDTFDLGSEVWGNVTQPPSCVESGFYVSQSLGVVDGCLCVFYDHPRIGVDVWVMKEYGVSESWAKIVTVPDIHLPLISYPSNHKPSLCVGPKGRILFVFGSIVLIYNPRNNKFTCPDMKNFGGFLRSHVYYESLVPLV
ncbi:hypothetical protein ABFS82_06G173200 [Erythranthe guttata]|uniref:F-box domain-containing protein n=1 Tax=Erythranthe guttata TaxID=4155 RepID=A0A022RIG6_ERYGU|nr:PREDICTED: F-box/kelch-repeat protein At3g23880-like [Erythranthe guttata]EYU39784.1 hypothetical protein MIMGU_mgv1a019667mg [Erythranthe guttata]|eukprot:XP_012834534.1 PREDICTED: F-box/kelch-repeat protein At3g23880-like [Erythranthe guttata]